MASVTLTIPDEQVDRVRAAFAARANIPVESYTAQEFQDTIAALVKAVVIGYEKDLARQAIVVVPPDVT